jgi:hypothetical protein
MTLEKQQRAVGIFAKFSDVELAVLQIQAANLAMIKVSILCTLTTSLGGVLSDLGISEEEIKIFSDLVSQGYYLVIVKGSSEDINTAKKILHQNSVQYTEVTSASCLSPGRYKNAVGLFFNQQNLEKALIELKAAEYPMNQVYLLTKEMLLNEGMSEVEVFTNDEWMKLEIPEHIATNYNHYLSIGGYLIIFGGTEIQIAAARTILAAHKVEEFSIYHPIEFS